MSKNDQDEKWDWSTRQVRLKTEMFLTSFTFLLLGLFEIDGLKFSPVIFSEGKGPEQWMIWLLFFGIAVFFTFSFYLRSQADLNGQAGGDLIAVSKMESVVKSDNLMVRKIADLEVANLDKIVFELGELNSDLNAISSAYNVSRKSFMAEFGHVLKHLATEMPEFRTLSLFDDAQGSERVDMESYPSVTKPYPSLAEIETIDNGKLFSDLIKSFHTTNNISNNFNDINNKMVNFQSAVSSYEKFLKSYDVAEALKQNLELKAATKKYLKNMSAVNKNDKIVMSYWIPLGFSLLFIAVSVVSFFIKTCLFSGNS